MRVAFRVDAAVHIGLGHVMRCLTLAAQLRSEGVFSHFICREFEGNLAQMILSEGHQLHLLPLVDTPLNESQLNSVPPHADWLGVSWETDLKQTTDALSKLHFDWLIVDHYALDFRWERGIRSKCKRIMVIDDLADRSHDCEAMLDQNLGRKKEDYRHLIPSGSQVFIGPEYALLKPEFSELRGKSLERRSHSIIDGFHVLISMGGVDSDNVTGEILNYMNESSLSRNLKITVVLGPTAVHVASVKKQVHELALSVDVLVGVTNMAELMLFSDLAIGAAGGTALERCCLGLPSFVFILAKNQEAGANALHKAGAAHVLGDISCIKSLGNKLDDIVCNPSVLCEMGQKSSLITEGKGASLIINSLGFKR